MLHLSKVAKMSDSRIPGKWSRIQPMIRKYNQKLLKTKNKKQKIIEFSEPRIRHRAVLPRLDSLNLKSNAAIWPAVQGTLSNRTSPSCAHPTTECDHCQSQLPIYRSWMPSNRRHLRCPQFSQILRFRCPRFPRSDTLQQRQIRCHHSQSTVQTYSSPSRIIFSLL